MGFSRQAYWSGLPFPSLGIFLTRIKPTSLMSPALADGFFTTSANWEVARKEKKTPILVLAESKGQRFLGRVGILAVRWSQGMGQI